MYFSATFRYSWGQRDRSQICVNIVHRRAFWQKCNVCAFPNKWSLFLLEDSLINIKTGRAKISLVCCLDRPLIDLSCFVVISMVTNGI